MSGTGECKTGEVITITHNVLCGAVPIRASKPPIHYIGFEKGSFGPVFHGSMMVSWQSMQFRVSRLQSANVSAYGDTNLIASIPTTRFL